MLDIKVLGPGCMNCEKLGELVHNVVDSLSIEAQISKVTNYAEIVELGVMTTPGLIINGEVVSSGRVPTKAEVTTMITSALAN
jgi:small redox-active disulfide protein 2